MNDQPIPVGIEKLYFYYLSNYVPKELNEISEGLVNPVDGLKIRTLINVYTPIQHDTRFMSESAMVRLTKFNSFSFRPNSRTNLTVWLFGTKKNPMQGKFPQLLSEKLDEYFKGTREYALGDFDEIIDDESNESKGIKESIKRGICKKWTPPNFDTLGTILNVIISKGNSRRDAEIFVKFKSNLKSQIELAEEYSLSRRQIIRICKKISKNISNN